MCMNVCVVFLASTCSKSPCLLEQTQSEELAQNYTRFDHQAYTEHTRINRVKQSRFTDQGLRKISRVAITLAVTFATVPPIATVT